MAPTLTPTTTGWKLESGKKNQTDYCFLSVAQEKLNIFKAEKDFCAIRESRQGTSGGRDQSSMYLLNGGAETWDQYCSCSLRSDKISTSFY